MAQWADYSAGRPGGAALRANGFSGTIRYVGMGDAGKRITAAEYQDLVAHGIQVLLVVELDTNDAWGNDNNPAHAYARGRNFAQAGLNEARAIGIPDSVGMAGAADAHAVNQAQIDCAVQYARAFRDVLGYNRAGFYAFNECLNAIHADNSVSWYWRCGAEPSGGWDPKVKAWTGEKSWVNFWQRNNGETVRYTAGIQCDVNEQYNPPVGGNDMFDQPDRDTLNLLKEVLVSQRHSLVPGANPNDNYDTGQYVLFIDNATNQTFHKVDDIKAELDVVKTELEAIKAAIVTPTVDLDALALKVAAQLKTLQFKA
jgi:hypothetical protein